MKTYLFACFALCGITRFATAQTGKPIPPTPQNLKLEWVKTTIQTDNDGKNSNSEFWIEVYRGPAPNPLKFAVYYDNSTEFKSHETKTVLVPFMPHAIDPTEADFNQGGAFLLRLTSHVTGHDDWHIFLITFTLHFTGPSNSVLEKKLSIDGVPFSDRDNLVFYFDKNFNFVKYYGCSCGFY